MGWATKNKDKEQESEEEKQTARAETCLKTRGMPKNSSYDPGIWAVLIRR